LTAPALRNLVLAGVASALGASCAGRAASPSPTIPRAVAPAPVASPPSPPWLSEVEAEVATLRGLPFLRAVPYARESRANFRTYVRAELARDLGPEKAADESRALAALGFVPAGFDLRAAMEDAAVTEVAAYYDTDRRDFRVLDNADGSAAGSGDVGDRGVVAHELTHALQDQHFGLEAFQGEHPVDLGLDDDEKLARQCVVEGEATFVMFAQMLGTGHGAGVSLGPFAVAGARMAIDALAAADVLDLFGVMREGTTDLDAESRHELEAVEKLPPWVTLPMIEPYFKGAAFVSRVWGQGGWPAVGRLYRRPPRSTEEVLHADKFLDGTDAPVRVRMLAEPPPLPRGPGTRLLETNVLGELGWRIYFKTWKLAAGDAAAAGWGGDRYWVWDRAGRAVAAIATTWDTDADADQFALTYEGTLAARFPRGVAGTDAAAPDAMTITTPGRRTIVVERHGRDVDVIDGAAGDERASLRRALRAAERRPATEGEP
jgi:hypothetical protein